jgi:hypothetical protein
MCFHNLINSNLNCHMVVNMHAMLMIMFWDVNACLTFRGVTARSGPLPRMKARLEGGAGGCRE